MSINVANLKFRYGNRPILNDITFTAPPNCLLSILGPNGVGKSTLFRCILGLLRNYDGTISVENTNVKTLSIKELAKLIAYIPQSHYPSFNFSVFDMVLMGTAVQISSISRPGTKQITLAEAALERVGIAHLKDRGYGQISGGERQLVLMARALVQESKILILDEPTANLDYGNQIRVLTQIKTLAREGYTIIQSTHNPDQTFMFSDHVLAIKDGNIVANGAPKDIFSDELIRDLYGVDVELQNLYGGKARICIPKSIVG